MGVNLLPVLEDTCCLVAEEARDVGSVLVLDDAFGQTAAVPDGAVAGELDGLVLDTGELHADVVAEVADLIVVVDREFPAAGAHLADILGDCAHPCGHAEDKEALLAVEHVVRCLLEEVEGNVESAVEEREVEAEVDVFDSFPLQVGVTHRAHDGGGEADGSCAEHIVDTVVESRHVSAVGDGLVAHTAPAEAYLGVVEPIAGIFHKGFFREAPCGRYRGECAVLVAFGEAARTVGTYRCGEVVAVVVVVHHAAEERSEGLVGSGAGSELVACAGRYFVEKVACAGNVLARAVKPPVGVAFGSEAGQHGEVVLFGEGVHIGDGVVPCPVEAVGVVASHGVLCVLFESVDVESAVEVIVTLIPGVDTELCADSELLDGSDLNEGVHQHRAFAGVGVHTGERAGGVPFLVVVRTLVVVHRVGCVPLVFGAEHGSGGVHRHGS